MLTVIVIVESCNSFTWVDTFNDTLYIDDPSMAWNLFGSSNNDSLFLVWSNKRSNPAVLHYFLQKLCH